MRILIITGSILCTLMWMQSCQQAGGNTTGSEYMPDMAHSVAYEANYYTYYSLNHWGSESEYYNFAKPRKPVKGTVPRNSSSSTRGVNTSFSGSEPFYFGDSEEERTRATEQVINNPYPITEAGMAKGKEMYDIYCGICHGDKGDGNGFLARDDSAYPVQPANLVSDEFTAASNGRLYYAIHYGKNLMGNYRDKLSWEERWQVIHYVRSLQAKNIKLVYNAEQNTLNTVDVPAALSATHNQASDGSHELNGDGTLIEESIQQATDATEDSHGSNDHH